MMKSAIISVGVLSSLLLVTAVALPFLQGDSGKARLKAVQAKREAFRDEISQRKPAATTLRERIGKKTFFSKLSTKLNLSNFGNMDRIRARLVLAGWRDPNTLPKYLVVRIMLPIVIASYLSFSIYAGPLGHYVPGTLRPVAVLFGAFIGFSLPAVLVKNAVQTRAKKMTKQFPDALDLMLVCVEAGLSIEQSFMRITQEIGDSIPEVAEEFALTGAELAFLGDRPTAYNNLVARTESTEFKGLATALSQSEVYGTSVGGALRALSEDSRAMRVLRVEKAAGSLGPKMTIPMILLILPCMFLMRVGPAVIQVMAITREH